MTKIQRHCFSALSLLVILCISTSVTLAQSPAPIDPFAVVPPADALLVLDLKRFSSDVIPRLLAGEPEARALVIAFPDPKTVELVDPRAVQHVLAAFRYTTAKDEKSPSDSEVLTVVRSSQAGQLPALIRTKGSGKYREQQYAGKILYLTPLEQSEPKNETTTVTSPDQTEWAIVALDANTLVFGSPAYVRSSIDVHSGKGQQVNADLVAAVKRNSKAFLSAAGLIPPPLMSAGKEWGNSDLSQMLASIKRFYASVELLPAGLDIAVSFNTASPEQTKSLLDFLGASKTLIGTVVPDTTRRDKLIRNVIKGLVISAAGTEVQIRSEIEQASVNEIAKQFGAQMYLSQGLAHVQEGESEAAIAEYDKSIKLDPENADTFVNRGKARANKGDLDASIADYDKATSLKPDHMMAYNNRCFARVKKGDFDAAIVDCDRAIAINPTFAYAYNNRGLAFASLGKLDKAVTDYDKSIAFDADNIFAYQNRGDLRVEIGNYDGAIADFEKCIALNAKSVEAYNGRGLARYYKGELDQALADYNQALSLDPNAAATYNNRAMALVSKGNLDQATADYEKAITLNDKNEVFYINRGDLRSEKEDWLGAIADFDKAIALNPKSGNAYNGRGLVRYSREELDQAIADFDMAIAFSPVAAIYFNRGLARSGKSNYDAAIADFDKAISLDPTIADAHNSRGVANYSKGQWDQAIADYDRAIAIDPNYAEAYGNRALSLLGLRRDAQAEQDLKKCFELNKSLRTVFDPLVKEIKKIRNTKPRK